MVEAAQPVVARAVEIIKQLRGFLTIALATGYELIEPLTVRVIERAVVTHRRVNVQTLLQPPIKIDEVRVDVTQQRVLWPQRQCHRQPAAKRLDQTVMRVRLPQRS